MPAPFPAGAVSGAPKIRAMQLIADLEGTTRGPHDSSWVNDSEPEAEFQETVNKSLIMLKALALAETFSDLAQQAI